MLYASCAGFTLSAGGARGASVVDLFGSGVTALLTRRRRFLTHGGGPVGNKGNVVAHCRRPILATTRAPMF